MITEQKVSELLNTFMVTKVVSGIKRLLLKTTAGSKSIPQSAKANYITFPVVVTDDISKEIAMDVAKTVEVKLAYDIKRILERRIGSGPRDARHDKIIEFLPFDNENNAVDVTAMRFIDQEISDSDLKETLTAESAQIKDIAITFARDQVNADDSEYYQEAHSAIVKERGAMPTSIDIEVKYIKGGEDAGEIKTATINMAINAIPRYVESNTLRMKLSTYDTKRFYKKFVNLTNKEESFISDFLLDIDLMKHQAKEATKKSSVFRDIERRNLMREMGVSKYPFTVFLVSDTFVDELKESERLDIYEESDMIMKKLLSMGLFVYNHDTDLVNVKYDGDKAFTTYPFDELTTDTSRYEKELKQLVRLNK